MLYSTHLLRHLRQTIGFNIHRLRTRRKMPLGVLARLSEISRDKLDLYELGKDEIPLDAMLKIACILDAEIRDLLCSDHPFNPQAGRGKERDAGKDEGMGAQ